VRRGLHGRRVRRGLLAAALGCATFAIAPACASAADPATGCTKTAGGDPATEQTEWTCYANAGGSGGAATVAGYEVKQEIAGQVPKPNIGVPAHITSMEVDVVDGGGAVPIDRLMLHHIVFFNSAQDGSRSDGGCGGPERFYGAGEERLKLRMPPGYGYRMDTGDNWWLIYMFMNHRAETDSAWIEYRLTLDPDSDIEDVRPYWLDVGDCRTDPIYNVPGVGKTPAPPKCKKAGKNAKPGARKKAAKCRKIAKKRKKQRAAQEKAAPTHNETQDVRVKEDGWIVAGAGHVHGGAKRLTVTKPGCAGNPEVARSLPTWGSPSHPFYNVKPVLHEPGPIGMSGFTTPTGIPVRRNETLRVNSIYDNLQPHSRVMGIYVTYVNEQDGTEPEPPACGGTPPDMTYDSGTGGVAGRSEPPAFKVPLTGLDQNGNAVAIDGPPGPFSNLGLGGTIQVGDRFFSQPNVTLRRGGTLNYAFGGNETHNVTLANGPQGIGTPNSGGAWTDFGFPGSGANGSAPQTFTRAGTYRLFCTWHPVQMHQRVVVKNPKKKRKKGKKK
jgi:plastocyanin